MPLLIISRHLAPRETVKPRPRLQTLMLRQLHRGLVKAPTLARKRLKQLTRLQDMVDFWYPKSGSGWVWKAIDTLF